MHEMVLAHHSVWSAGTDRGCMRSGFGIEPSKCGYIFPSLLSNPQESIEDVPMDRSDLCIYVNPNVQNIAWRANVYTSPRSKGLIISGETVGTWFRATVLKIITPAC